MEATAKHGGAEERRRAEAHGFDGRREATRTAGLQAGPSNRVLGLRFFVSPCLAVNSVCSVYLAPSTPEVKTALKKLFPWALFHGIRCVGDTWHTPVGRVRFRSIPLHFHERYEKVRKTRKRQIDLFRGFVGFVFFVVKGSPTSQKIKRSGGLLVGPLLLSSGAFEVVTRV